MEQAETKWNDDRLDHLSGQVDSVRDQVNALQHHMDNRFDRLQNAMIITHAREHPRCFRRRDYRDSILKRSRFSGTTEVFCLLD